MSKIYMIGDSIMQTNKYETYPQTGWGQVLNLFVDDKIEIVNLAKNGTSTKSFIDQGRFKIVEENIKKNDLLIIGFAHNDEKILDPLRYTEAFSTFKDNLKYFINVAKRNLAKVIVCTPVVRRNFIENVLIETHGDYIEAIKQVSVEENITLVDLNKLTYEVVSSLNEEGSKKLYMNFQKGSYDNYVDGHEDNSHLRYDGAVLIARLFVEELFRNNNEERKYFLSLSNTKICASDTYEK